MGALVGDVRGVSGKCRVLARMAILLLLPDCLMTAAPHTSPAQSHSHSPSAPLASLAFKCSALCCGSLFVVIAAFAVLFVLIVVAVTYTLLRSGSLRGGFLLRCHCHRLVRTCIYTCFHFRSAYHIIASSLPTSLLMHPHRHTFQDPHRHSRTQKT